IALGTCAAYGGIPAGAPNPTGNKGVADFLKGEKIKTPVINIPGCPPHPDWFVGTVADILLFGLPKPGKIDKEGRPKAFYGKTIHDSCQRRSYYEEGKYAEKFGDEGCMIRLGCKGPDTHADCPIRLWNSGVNWCVGAGSICQGCTEPGFPDKFSPIFAKLSDEELKVRLAGINGKELLRITA
ncbi:MAG: oxidoreductase, partial [Deltaproteobacteria bacterium]|nr:oxidoreductase [Deltaproteobacteria bacterium]